MVRGLGREKCVEGMANDKPATYVPSTLTLLPGALAWELRVLVLNPTVKSGCRGTRASPPAPVDTAASSPVLKDKEPLDWLPG